VDILEAVAVSGPHERAVRVLEVLHLVAVTVPVDRQHRGEVPPPGGGWDVRRDLVLAHPAEVPVAARGVEEAFDAPVIAAVTRREPGAAAQVHGVPQGGPELREVPGAAVLAPEV